LHKSNHYRPVNVHKVTKLPRTSIKHISLFFSVDVHRPQWSETSMDWVRTEAVVCGTPGLWEGLPATWCTRHRKLPATFIGIIMASEAMAEKGTS